jgi:phospholipid/cholesterol/gamma-HCH transport system substrate-binding protein
MTGGVGENDRYYVFYQNVGGLSEGTPVTYEGFKVGFVETIGAEQVEQGTRYRVDLRVRDHWRIPTDSVARIYSEGLLAETVINIEEGENEEYLSPGAEIPGRQGADVFAALSDLAEEMGGLSSDTLRPLLDNLNRRIDQVGDELGERLPRVLAGMESLLEEFASSAERFNALVDEDNQTKVLRVIDNADQMSANMLVLSEELLQLRTRVERLVADSSGVVADNREDLREAVLSLRRSLESVAAYSEGILQNLEGASRNMNEFSRQIRENPGLLLGGKAPAERGVRP